MLLKKLSVVNNRGSEITLPLGDPSGGILVKEIEGLGPVKATIVSSSFAGEDGAQYHSSRRETRNIVIRLGLDPDTTQMSVKDLRDQLYNFLMPKTEALLKFNLFDKLATNIIEQQLDLQIQGRVESLEPAMFSKEPAVDISVLCFKPDFIDPETVVFEGMSVSDLTETPLDYKGSVNTGVVFTLFPDRLVEEFTIYHRTPEEKLKVTYFTLPLNAGSELEISTIFGEKRVVMTEDGVESPVLYGLSQQSNWLELEPGENNLRVYAEGAPVPFSIEYTTKYGGL